MGCVTAITPKQRGFILIPLFFLIAISILYLGHYFVYVSIVHFFGITAFEPRLALVVVLLLLPLSFIASAFIAHWRDGFLTRVFYYCSTLWLGVGLTLLTAFVLAWTAEGLARGLHRVPNLLWLGCAAVGLTILYSAYGIVNAYHPRVVSFNVRIRNLPPNWKGKTLVQLSDVHLGRILGAKFLARIVDQVNALKPDMVMITGDLFDGADGNLESLVAPLNHLYAPLGVYFATGNHETYLGVDRSIAALKTTPARVLSDERVVIDGLQVIGIGYPQRGESLRFAEKMARLRGFDPTLPSILLYHSPTQVAAAKAAGISLQLSGHVHQGQIFPLQFVTRLIFGRYYHGLHTEGDYTLYTSSGTGVWGPTMRTGNHPEIAIFHLA
ncbi:MAG TPA: metallophosphoesterase [Terriglobia bacterium]|nr:metallophosphoesterase [Terriglobia bacterium]